MIRSTDRILTTHVGSLPRPEDLIQIMYAKEEGIPVDRIAMAARVETAVAEIVANQVGAGIDIVNDGEMSKPSYATYIKDRLAGFGGESNSFVYQDVAEFPKMAERVFNDPGRSRRTITRRPRSRGYHFVVQPYALWYISGHLGVTKPLINIRFN
jgi:5-methyltetrahydropteroyltriglutamate--homocysteine methyltransferase